MSYSYKILKDHPIGFWKLDDSTTEAIDLSGCGNNGIYTGLLPSETKIMPMVSGIQHSAKITSSSSIEFPIINDYYGQPSDSGFGTQDTADNSFTLECWILPKIFITNRNTTIFGDQSNKIGIFWANNTVIFTIGYDEVHYTVPEINKSIYIACKYSTGYASIYIDGNLAVSQKIVYPLDNTDILLKSGPTEQIQDEFLIGSPAVYRYALSEKQIKEHYLSNQNTIPIQIAHPDNGEIFNIYDNGMRTSFTYNYPKDKSWQYFLTEGLTLNNQDNYIEITKTPMGESATSEKEVIIKDIISIPSGIAMDSSKIEWNGSSGISVYTSLDEDIYEQCINGQSIPQYKYGNFNEQKFIYIKIIIQSPDSGMYLPKLYSLSINFYSEQIIYAKNGGSYISKIDNLDYSLGKEVYPVLSMNKLNGIVVPNNSGFKVNLPYNVNSIEFFYTPGSILKGALVSSNTTEFSWADSGSILKSNISKIYVNGEDKTAASNISSVLNSGYLNHIIIVFEDSISEEVIFNYKDTGSQQGLYQHITLYKDAIDQNKANNHYNLYIGRSVYTSTASTMSMTENSTKIYNNDWIVIQNS
jgi:hypothetical protein